MTRRAETLGWIAASAALAVVTALAIAYHFEPVAGWDEDVAAWVARSMPAWLEDVSLVLSRFGGGWGMAVVAIAAAIALARRGRRSDGVLVAVACIGVQISTLVLKVGLDRPRPDLDPVIELPGTAAYPSGHASAALAVLVVVAFLFDGRVAIVAGAALALAIGASRVVLGVHWTSDVVGGWALGLAWVAGLVALRSRAARARGS